MPGVRSRTDGARFMAMSIASALRVEWHDFRTEQSFDWGQTFHPRSLEFCLNLQGHGEIGAPGKTRGDYAPGNCGYYAIGDEPLAASRARSTIVINSLPSNSRGNICKNSSPIAKAILIRKCAPLFFQRRRK